MWMILRKKKAVCLCLSFIYEIFLQEEALKWIAFVAEKSENWALIKA
jgi:hypothetical protein